MPTPHTIVRALIPQRAKSPTAVLACAADQIVLGSFASLSPATPLTVVPTMSGSIMEPAQAMVDVRNEPPNRLWSPKETGEELAVQFLVRQSAPVPAMTWIPKTREVQHQGASRNQHKSNRRTKFDHPQSAKFARFHSSLI